MAAKIARIYGLVQGVNYRRDMQAEAFRIGLSGWVRNRMDGSVEALLCGEPETIDRMLEWAKRGPPFSRVERVEVADGQNLFADSFEVLPTE